MPSDLHQSPCVLRHGAPHSDRPMEAEVLGVELATCLEADRVEVGPEVRARSGPVAGQLVVDHSSSSGRRAERS